jgi:hypothetical protein
MKRALCGVLMLGWIPTLAIVAGARWADGESLFAQSRTPVKVTRLYTGTDGKTKVEEFEIPVKPRDSGSDLSGSVAVTSLQVRRTNEAYSLDWHTAPRRQLVVTLAGERRTQAASWTGPHSAGGGHHGPGAQVAGGQGEGSDRARHRPRRRRRAAAMNVTGPQPS